MEPPLTRVSVKPNIARMTTADLPAESSLATRLAAREDGLWHGRGRRALFAVGVALALGALVTFVAHNWVYLGTVWKLGLIGAALLLCALYWVARGLDRGGAEVAGIAAQVLIGVWLAAAGQLYQVPGTAGDLLFRWALLGLPFALASRSRAHWVVWALVAVGAVFGGGDWVPGGLNFTWRVTIGGAALALGYVAKSLTLPGWSATLFAALALLAVASGGSAAVFDPGMAWLPWLAAMLVAGGLFWHGLRRGDALSVPSLASAAFAYLFGIALFRLIVEGRGDGVGVMLLVTLLVGGLTFALLKVFGWLRSRFGEETDMPWYMDALTAIGGILTAIFGAAFLGALLGVLFVATDTVELGMLIAGIPLYLGGLVLRLRAVSLFRRYLATTVMLVGGAAAAAGFIAVTDFDSLGTIGAVVLALSLPPYLLIRDRIVEVIMALGIAAGMGLVVADVFWESGDVGFGRFALMLFAVLGSLAHVALFALRGPPRLASVAVWLLVAAGALLGSGVEGWVTRSRIEDLAQDWPLLVAGFAVLFGLLASAKATVLRHALPGWGVLAALSLVAVLLPLGAAPIVLMLLLGYALGSRSLFLIGLVGVFGYLFAAYFDLSMTLMEMSAVMTVSAALVLGMWRLSKQRTA